jgi:iron complex outermembrane recepter protein
MQEALQAKGVYAVPTATLDGNRSDLDQNTLGPGGQCYSAPSFDCAGLFGGTCLNGSVNPTWRHILRVNWQTRWNMLLSAQGRFIGSTEFDNNSPQTLLQNQEEGFYDPLLTHIPKYNYLDLSAIWTVAPYAQVRVGVNNVFDKDPPFVPFEVSGAAGNLNTFPAYDVLGRTLFMGFRVTF